MAVVMQDSVVRTHGPDVTGAAAPDVEEIGIRWAVGGRPIEAVRGVDDAAALTDRPDVVRPASPHTEKPSTGRVGAGGPVHPVVVDDRGADRPEVRRASPHAVQAHVRWTRDGGPVAAVIVEDDVPDRPGVVRRASPEAVDRLGAAEFLRPRRPVPAIKGTGVCGDPDVVGGVADPDVVQAGVGRRISRQPVRSVPAQGRAVIADGPNGIASYARQGPEPWHGADVKSRPGSPVPVEDDALERRAAREPNDPDVVRRASPDSRIDVGTGLPVGAIRAG